MRTHLVRLAVVLAAALLVPGSGAVLSHARSPHGPARHSTSLKMGGFFLEGDSEQWEFQDEVFDSDADEFDDFALALGYSYQFHNFFAASAETMLFDGGDRTRFRDLLDTFRQKSDLELLTLTGSILWQPAGRYRSGGGGYPGQLRAVVPYLGLGGGVLLWDFETRVQIEVVPRFYRFLDQERDDGATPVAVATLGLEIPVGGAASVHVEARYFWAEDDLDRDFFGPRELDLSGWSLRFGGAYRF